MISVVYIWNNRLPEEETKEESTESHTSETSDNGPTSKVLHKDVTSKSE